MGNELTDAEKKAFQPFYDQVRAERAARFAKNIGERSDKEVQALLKPVVGTVPLKVIAAARRGDALGYGLASALSDATGLSLYQIVDLNHTHELRDMVMGLHERLTDLERRVPPK